MELEDLILVSVDDHVVEPPDLFANHLTERWRDIAPRIEHRDDGSDVWVYDGNVIPNIGLNAVAGRPPEEYGMEPTSFDELRDGTWSVAERVRDMNANGVLGSMCFPSFPNLCGQLFARSTDKDAGLAVLQAYNDWHIEDWCGAAPDRFIPLMIPPIWDAELMAAEVRRCAAKGCHAVTFSENPAKLKLPSFHDASWNPFWEACVETDMMVCLHIGSSSSLAITAPDAPVDVLITLQPVNIVQAAADLMWSPVLRAYPELRVSLSEGGIGWVPYFLERMDWIYTRHRYWTGQDFGDLLPSEFFRQRITLCFIDDPAGCDELARGDASSPGGGRLAIDQVCWEMDYPHSDSTWPVSPETLWPAIEQLDDGVINQITWRNALRHFRYDPFGASSDGGRGRTPEESTVGALRALATDVDVTPRSKGKRAGARTGAAELIQIGDAGRRRNR